jgi:zinc/manganese transport system substrate-binding protein
MLPSRSRSRSRASSSRSVAAIAALALGIAACGGGSVASPGAEPDAGGGDDPISVVATTSILGDVVSQLVGDDGEVTVLMGPGVDPHAYAPSARDGAAMREADLVVANGLQLEESLIDTLEATEEAGVPVFELAPVVDPLAFGEDPEAHAEHTDEGDAHAEDEHAGEGDAHAEDEHADEGDAHADEDGHEHGPEDPHVWFDAERMATGIELLAAELAGVAPQVDAAEWESRAAAYVEQLREVDAELTAAFEAVPEERRVIVTNHDSLGYLAARYDLEVVGTVIPGSSTQVEADAKQFAALVDTLESHGVEAIFADNTDSTRLAEQLASESLGRTDLEVEVVQVATDALGEPGTTSETYLGLLRETGTTIAATLAGE